MPQRRGSRGLQGSTKVIGKNTDKLLRNYQAIAGMRMLEQLQELPEAVAGCLERLSSKAAASGEARRTLVVR